MLWCKPIVKQQCFPSKLSSESSTDQNIRFMELLSSGHPPMIQSKPHFDLHQISVFIKKSSPPLLRRTPPLPRGVATATIQVSSQHWPSRLWAPTSRDGLKVAFGMSGGRFAAVYSWFSSETAPLTHGNSLLQQDRNIDPHPNMQGLDVL